MLLILLECYYSGFDSFLFGGYFFDISSFLIISFSTLFISFITLDSKFFFTLLRILNDWTVDNHILKLYFSVLLSLKIIVCSVWPGDRFTVK